MVIFFHSSQEAHNLMVMVVLHVLAVINCLFMVVLDVVLVVRSLSVVAVCVFVPLCGLMWFCLP